MNTTPYTLANTPTPAPWPGSAVVPTAGNSSTKRTAAPTTPQFGLIGKEFSRLYNNVMSKDASKAIAEDVLGFGVFRTLFDLFRPYFYKGNTGENDLNLSLARERVVREMGNLFSSNFLSGLVIFSLAKGMHTLGKKNLGNEFIGLETQEVFRHFTASPYKNSTPEQFIHRIAGYLAKGNPTETSRIAMLLNKHGQLLSPEKRAKDLAELKQLTNNISDTKLVKIANQVPANASVGSVEKTISAIGHHVNFETGQLEAAISKLEKALAKGQKAAKNNGDLAQWLASSKADNLNKQLAQKSKALAMWQPLKQTIHTQEDITERAAKKITHTLNPKQTHFDITRTLPTNKYKHTFSASEFITDVHRFLTNTKGRYTPAEQAPTRWAKHANKLLKRTQRFNRWGIPLAYGVGFALTVAVPILNKLLTQKVDNTKSYPGIKGLMSLKPVDTEKAPWYERLMPYVTEELKKGNSIPLLLGLLPLPLAFGMVNNAALRAGKFANIRNNPFKRGGARKLLRLFQFRKGFPFVSVQQLAALCATVAATRNLTTRDGLEMRERFVDTYAGWLLWIPIIPNIHRLIAKKLDKKHGTHMVKHKSTGGVLRSGAEIRQFFPKAAVNKTLGILGKLDKRTFVAMVFMLGIVEPYIAIKWTEQQAKKLRKEEKENQWAQAVQSLTAQTPPHYIGPPALNAPQQVGKDPTAWSSLVTNQVRGAASAG